MPHISKEFPIKLKSPNRKEHWSATSRRNNTNFLLIKQNFPEMQDVMLPCTISIERFSKRFFDFDNFVFSCKGIRDSVASIILRKNRGIGDNHPLITWEYRQLKGDDCLRIEITWPD